MFHIPPSQPHHFLRCINTWCHQYLQLFQTNFNIFFSPIIIVILHLLEEFGAKPKFAINTIFPKLVSNDFCLSSIAFNISCANLHSEQSFNLGTLLKYWCAAISPSTNISCYKLVADAMWEEAMKMKSNANIQFQNETKGK